MIAFLHGQPIAIEDDSAIVNVHGVGYELMCSTNTLDHLKNLESVDIYIHTHVREDALLLFGFSTLAEKKVFLSLIKVNGIGPKLAISVLSAAPVEHIVHMIETEDAKGLAKLPRIGKKTAEQIILSLKGKLVRSEEAPTTKTFTSRDEIVSALVHLGFRLGDVEKVVEQMSPSTDVQTGIRQGLAALTN